MTRNLSDDLKIDPFNLNGEIIQQPGLYGYYAEQLRLAQRALKLEKLNFDVFESALDRQIRDVALSKGEKPTERMIETRMRANDNWVIKKRNIIELESQVDQLDAVVRSLGQKKDMLVTLASNIRSEMSAGFSIKDEQRSGRQSGPVNVPPLVVAG